MKARAKTGRTGSNLNIDVTCTMTQATYNQLENALTDFALAQRLLIEVVDEDDSLIMVINGRDEF